MSATLHATGLSAGHGARTLFSDLDLVVAPGDVIGLVGANGAGKSTLLRLLAGEQPPDEGTITLAPPDATVGHLPQEPERRPGETLAAFLARRTGVADALVAMDATAQDLADSRPGADDAYAAALDRWLALGGADLDERAAELLADLGLGVSPEAEMTGLSGGQAARAGLAALLLSRYDLLLREVARRHAREAYEEYSDKLGGLKERAVMQRNWMAQGVRNVRRKAGSEPDKNIRAMRKETSEKQASKARQTEKAIERLDVVEEPRKEWELQMTIASAPRSGAVAARADAALVRRGGFVLGPVTAQVDWADRVVITGANGSGKSTLLGALLGRIPTESGSAGLGAGVRVGEIDQARGAFLGPQTLLRSFGTEVPDWPESEVRTLLAKFALTREQVLRPAASLSPGERTRAALALLQAREVNLLVLDEPTNHLDLPAIEQLEQAVESFAGTVLLVTHDRRMLDTVRATRRWNVERGGLTEL
ncbi:ATP-binding cassette domain-containing protein [Pseudonocardia sp. KRD291]|uniref:ATP-binding cassette domain-containing protein n=1 Tax=Pseudonocardia sp. KRD291 TaxID=2792007 RepID=UPI001C49D158|nr:ATP-binding cassette domain-containing protein [Pseudonocardia sp. KRD291]MBW0104425.1 ABC-F family ATP-binding cassette domain-containing protein [Pseudonocardia sp. KRD291]